jgi:hypothetical protein
MDTQWNVAGMGGQPIGLKYEVIESVARLADIGIEPRAPLFVNLRVMERAALAAFAELRKREAAR